MKDSSGLKQLIDQYFTSLKLEQRLPVRLYEPIDYILKLKAKRMRPILTMLSYHAVSGQPAEEAIDLATAVEVPLFPKLAVFITDQGSDSYHVLNGDS